MKAFLELWPLLIVGAQVVLVILVLWVVLLVKREVTTAVKPVQDEQNNLDRRVKVTEERLCDVVALDARMDIETSRITELTGRVNALAADIEGLPTKADLARVEGEVKVVNAKMDSANGGIKRLEDYFLAKGTGASA